MDLRYKTTELLERHSWLKPAASLSTFIIVLICFGFGAFSIACCLCSLCLGVSIAAWIANDSNGRFLYPLVHMWFSSQFKETANKRNAENEDSSSQKRRVVPWKELEIPASVNDALESLLDQIIDEYVNNWYESEISRDRAFINEIRYQIRFACSKILTKALALDLPAVVAEDFLPTIALHMHRIIEKENELSEKAYPRSLIESHICEKLADLHFCMGSRRNELDYLRQIADFLIAKLVDDTHLAGRAHDDDSPSRMGANGRNMSSWPSQSARHFLRELVVNAILFPCLDLIADPDTINHLLILAFDAQKADDEEVSHLATTSNDVTLLTNFTEPTSQSVPDSLLQLKLSELLRDARQFSMFRLYLQDTRGPVHELSFLAEASRIHDSMQRKTESSSQIAYDIWQLFGQFVHDSAPEKIEFDEEIVNEFKAAVECNNLLLLDKIIEKSYQVVYQRMQTDHVIPFCQSDAFLGYLCGSPPVCVNELIDQRSVPRKPSVSGGTFSLAQFRMKLRRAIAGVSSDSMESEDSLGSGFSELVDDTKNENAVSESGKEAQLARKSSASSFTSRSLSQLSLPSIDVSMVGDAGNISPASGYSGTDEDDVSSSSAVEASNAEPVLVIDKETRNINQWKVNISKIVPMRDSTTGRTVYVYVIDVERKEAKEKETKCWCIYRRFAEFYVLEMKLLEFHGDSLRFTLLPPRKTLVSRNRAFLEQHRLLFSLFLSSLCKQNMLQRSDLLFAFLTSSEEFRQNILLSDLNPWKVVKKMPGKLSREKGQHLRPFLLTVLANTLFTQEKVEFKEKFEASESSSLSSLSVSGEQYHTSFYNPLFGNNCYGCKIAENEGGCMQSWSKSFTDGMSLLFFSVMSHASHWTMNIHSALRLLCRNTIDYLMLHLLKRLYWIVFSEVNLVTLTQLIQTAIFCSDGSLPSDQEKSLREELATRRALEFAQEEMPSCVLRVLDSKSWRGGVKRLVNTLQYPRLNKHLSYLLMDLLMTKLFPEELS
uniref:Sorting nexin-14 n=1 Tax=Haemonchus contortus TaxID=6289 RepID=A0A7I4Y1H0_HAECO|nr:Phox-associated and Regulator of G protein signalling and Phox and Sorting nexin domain containing protein [Haemonchus contortus]